MKKSWRLIYAFILGLLLMSGMLSFPAPAMAQGEGSISGTVVDAVTSDPIPNVRIWVTDFETNQMVGGTYTDESGNYSVLLPTGTYKVRAYPSATGLNYFDEFYDKKYSMNIADPVSVTAPDDTLNINFSLEMAGTISGTVIDADTLEPV